MRFTPVAFLATGTAAGVLETSVVADGATAASDMMSIIGMPTPTPLPGSTVLPGQTVVDSFTTYCTEDTILVHAGRTYTVTAHETLTVTDCPCTIPHPQPVPTTSDCVTTTVVTDTITTYCPSSGPVTIGTKVTTVTGATTITITVPVTKTIPVGPTGGPPGPPAPPGPPGPPGPPAPPAGTCVPSCYSLTATGGAKGPVYQLGDGQNRVGGSGPPGTYCLKDGVFTDQSGRGCILTPPTTQFQCDVGATGSPGFSVQGGQVAANGSTTFYGCPVNDQGVYNIYTTPVPNQQGCVQIGLTATGNCPAPPTGPAPPGPPAPPAGPPAGPPAPPAPPATYPPGPKYPPTMPTPGKYTPTSKPMYYTGAAGMNAPAFAAVAGGFVMAAML